MANIIIDVIISFAILGLAFQLKALLGYRTELTHLKRAQNAMGTVDVSESIEVLISRTSVSERSIVGHRIRQVKDIARSPAPPSVADLSSADFERDDSRFESVLPNTLISILLIIGLAGTLLSFKTIIGDFPVEGKTTVEITNWMNKAYPAFGLAFKASLWGIGGTVVLLVFRSFVHNRRSELFDRLDRFTAAPLYPRFFEQRATDATTLAHAGLQLLETSAIFKQSVVKMEGIPGALTSATSGLADAANETRVALNSAAAAFTEFHAGFAESGAVRESLLRLNATVIGFERQTEAVAGTLQEAVSGATNAMKETGDAIAGVGGVVASAGQSIERCVAQLLAGNNAHAEKMDAVVLSIGRIVEATSRNQREWGEAILPAIRAMTESAGKLDNSMGPFSICAEALAKTVEQIEKSTTQFVSTGEAQAKRLDASAESIERSTELSIANHREFLKGLEPMLVTLPRRVLEFAQQQGQLLRQLGEIGAELRAEIARVGFRVPSMESGFWRGLFSGRFWRQ